MTIKTVATGSDGNGLGRVLEHAPVVIMGLVCEMLSEGDVARSQG